LSTLKRLRKN